MNESRASEASRERGQSSVRIVGFIDALKFKPQEPSSILQDFRFWNLSFFWVLAVQWGFHEI